MTRTLALLAILGVVFGPRPAAAHYCSNIFSGPARLVVKPEKSTVYVVPGGAKLRVYLQNNFPYTLFGVRMQGVASGYTITVVPGSAGHTVHPGQNVSYLFTITGPTGNVTTTTLNLQVLFRVGGWRTESNKEVNQNPTQASLISGTQSSYGSTPGEQSPALNAGMLLEKFPTATLQSAAPFFGRNAAQQLTKWFGYRFCYNTSGAWRCGTQDCPSPCAEGTHWTGTDQFPQDCMRAGVELATRKAKLGSDLAGARDGATNALKGTGSADHKCLAAVVGAYLWLGGTPTTFTTELAVAGNSVPASCQAAALRILGSGSAGNCASLSAFYERAACAAAEGIAGNNSPVQTILIPNSGDGASSSSTDWTMSLYYAYMLAIVSSHRYATAGYVSYFADAGPPTGDGAPPPPADTRPPDTRPPDSKKADSAQPKVDVGVKVDIAVKKDSAQPKIDIAVKKDSAQPKADLAKADLPKVGDNGLLPDGITPPAGDLAAVDGLPPTGDKGGAKKEATVNPGDSLDGGCGCRTATSSGHPASGLLILAALALGLALRRRRR